MHQRLDNAMALIEEQFRATKIVDLLDQPGTLIPLREQRDEPRKSEENELLIGEKPCSRRCESA